jgi:hypothetical protein|tara:strand:- start:2987 stop:4297 length:1311 start_codon:yes stop_codon:yes gene_type:complete
MSDALKRISEAKGWSIEETKENFTLFIKGSFPDAWGDAGNSLAGISDEDADFFASSFEATEIRRGGGGKGQQYVGIILGHGGKRDLMRRQRTQAQESAEIDLNNLLRFGLPDYPNMTIGRGYYSDGKWVVANAADQIIHSDAGSESDIPDWAVAIPGKPYYVALMGKNGPKTAYSYKREWICAVNTPEAFLKEGPIMPPIRLECSYDSVDVNLMMNQPISFQADKEASWSDPNTDILKVSVISPTYGLDWADESIRDKAAQMFSPEQVLTQFIPFVQDLAEVHDYHDNNLIHFNNGGTGGPTFAIRGVVDYMDHDGDDTKSWADGGAMHSMTLMSQSLRREDSNASMWLNVTRYLKDKHNAFNVFKNGRWNGYAKGSQVIAVVTSRTWENRETGDILLNLDANNVYAIPTRTRVAPEPTDEANDLGGLDGFRGDDA